ncbi:MAG TPA: MoxR family ATPase [Polyangiales bacterium]|nr:MoxR family ATPase [Polyangiales bacterium]
MSLFYRETCQDAPSAPVQLPSFIGDRQDDPRGYIADPGLVHAVNTALLLGKPMLITGEPGTGKTQLAASVALQLGYGEPMSFVAKSISQSQDLFYGFDALARLKSGANEPHRPSGAPPGPRPVEPGAVEFIRYNALGMAILFANEPDRVRHLLPSGMKHPGKRRSVVLIDEVDKAPRDFPNDLLFELEHMAFRVPELNAFVQAEPELRPVVIITSNSERGLPDPFLRRCVYHDIEFPDRDRLQEILLARLGKELDADFGRAALDLFAVLRADGLRLSKKPSTAELIGWMIALLRHATLVKDGSELATRALRNPLSRPETAKQTLGALIKSREDRKQALPEVERWAAAQAAGSAKRG